MVVYVAPVSTVNVVLMPSTAPGKENLPVESRGIVTELAVVSITVARLELYGTLPDRHGEDE